MLGILGFLLLFFAAFFCACVVGFRVGMANRYTRYSRSQESEGKPYSWLRFFIMYQARPFESRDRFGQITFPRYLAIASISLLPVALFAYFFL